MTPLPLATFGSSWLLGSFCSNVKKRQESTLLPKTSLYHPKQDDPVGSLYTKGMGDRKGSRMNHEQEIPLTVLYTLVLKTHDMTLVNPFCPWPSQSSSILESKVGMP